jgi:hypothetical protein
VVVVDDVGVPARGVKDRPCGDGATSEEPGVLGDRRDVSVKALIAALKRSAGDRCLDVDDLVGVRGRRDERRGTTDDRPRPGHV